jgi:hypothetical protein
MASKAEKTTKAQETHLGNILNQHMYAVIKDHNNSSDRLDPCKSVLYQTYDNLIRKKDDPDKADGRESRFSIQTEVKQHLAHIFRSCGSEISKVVLAKDAKVADIITSLTEEFQDDSVAAPFLQLGITYAHCFGETLKNSVDESNWIHAQVTGMLPHLKTNLQLIAEIATGIDQSVRALAWFLGRSVWLGAEKSISSETFVYALSLPTVCMYSLNTLDTISKDVRAKAPRPKGVSKTKSAVTEGTVTEGTVTEGTVTDAVADAVAGAVNDVTAASTSHVGTVAPPAGGVSDDIQKALEGI